MLPNEVGIIAQHVRKREGRKKGKDGVGYQVETQCSFVPLVLLARAAKTAVSISNFDASRVVSLVDRVEIVRIFNHDFFLLSFPLIS